MVTTNYYQKIKLRLQIIKQRKWRALCYGSPSRTILQLFFNIVQRDFEPPPPFLLKCNINRGRLPPYESWWKMCQHYWNLVVAGIEELLLSRGEYSWCWRWWSQKGRLTLQAGRACSLKSESVQPNNGYSWSWKSQLLLFCFCKEYLSFTGEYILCGHDVFSLSSSILLGDVFSFQLWDISFLQVRVVGVLDFSY